MPLRPLSARENTIRTQSFHGKIIKFERASDDTLVPNIQTNAEELNRLRTRESEPCLPLHQDRSHSSPAPSHHEPLPFARPPFPWSRTEINIDIESKKNRKKVFEYRFSTVSPPDTPKTPHKPKIVLPEIHKSPSNNKPILLIKRRNVSALRKNNTPQYIMCGKAIGVDFPMWLDTKAVLKHSDKIKRINITPVEHSNLSLSIERNHRDSSLEEHGNEIQRLVSAESTENSKGSNKSIIDKKLELLKIITRGIKYVKSTGGTMTVEQKSAMSALVDRLLKDELNADFDMDSRLMTKNASPRAVSRWKRRENDSVMNMIAELQITRPPTNPIGMKKIPDHYKQTFFLPIHVRTYGTSTVTNPQESKIKKLDKGTERKRLASDIRKRVQSLTQTKLRLTDYKFPVNSGCATRGVGRQRPRARKRTLGSVQIDLDDKPAIDIVNEYLLSWLEAARLNCTTDLTLKPNHNCKAANRTLDTLKPRF